MVPAGLRTQVEVVEKPRTLVILGHPRAQSLCGGLAEAYRRGAAEQGAEARVLALGELDFDPILRQGFGGSQPLEDDLLRAREAIEWANHVTWVYPVWWGSTPALLKGFIDRTFLPGWAFNARPSGRPEGLLAGRSARTLVTMDAPRWFDRMFYGASARRSMQRATLWYTGFAPIRSRVFPTVLRSDDEVRARWLKQAAADAAHDVALVRGRVSGTPKAVAEVPAA